MLGRSHCLFIAVNQMSCYLKGLKYKKFQWQSWSAKPGRAVGVGNSRKPRASSSTGTPSTGPSAGLDALQRTKLCYSSQAWNHSFVGCLTPCLPTDLSGLAYWERALKELGWMSRPSFDLTCISGNFKDGMFLF